MDRLRIGIIGAGQLGALLCRAAKNLGYQTTVLAGDRSEMAVSEADKALIGQEDDIGLLEQLLANSDVVTFEKEDIPSAALAYLDEHAASQHASVAPQTAVMRLLQNKASQKRWLQDNDFPTAPFIVFDEGLQANEAQALFGDKYVIKSQTGGYDGLGVAIVRDAEPASQWLQAPCLAEAFVENTQELAVLVARSANGESSLYPVFSSVFDGQGNLLREVVCPAPITAEQSQDAQQLALAVVEGLQGVGLFAVEMFLTASGGLVINEIAPRVHNVGHLTIEACHTSQFEQHLRAITGTALGSAELHSGVAVMANLLYEPKLANACVAQTQPPQLPPDVNVHWYGKREYRPLRKMGHVTALGGHAAEAQRNLDRAIDIMAAS